MFKDIFVQLGLTQNEAVVYEYLLKNGDSTAGTIIDKTPLKRGVVYNALADLASKGLVTEKKKDKVAIFTPEHPDKLRINLEDNEQKLQKAQKTLDANLADIISSFNLVSNKPNVRIYEGKQGLIKVLNDSLSSKTEILTYAQIEGMEKYLGRENDKYVGQRKVLGIHKRGIVADTPYARDYLKGYDKSVTEIRFIDGEKFPMQLEMEIYDGKISFMTFSDTQLIGMIIDNPEIYEMQKSIFELAWQSAHPLD